MQVAWGGGGWWPHLKFLSVLIFFFTCNWRIHKGAPRILTYQRRQKRSHATQLAKDNFLLNPNIRRFSLNRQNYESLNIRNHFKIAQPISGSIKNHEIYLLQISCKKNWILRCVFWGHPVVQAWHTPAGCDTAGWQIFYTCRRSPRDPNRVSLAALMFLSSFFISSSTPDTIRPRWSLFSATVSFPQ